MKRPDFKDRFKTTKEELAKLASEFYSEALPVLDKLYNISYWIFLEKKATQKTIKQIYFEAIEYCDKTKAHADWWSWIHRIWMREINDYYVPKENDNLTVFDFIDLSQVNHTEADTFFNNYYLRSNSILPKLITSLRKLPSILRIPLMLKEVHKLSYEKIAELVDVPDGVIATRIYRARKLLFFFLHGNYDYEKKKKSGLPDNFKPIIFDLRMCGLAMDEELNGEKKLEIERLVETEEKFKTEFLIQQEIQKILKSHCVESVVPKRIRIKIEKEAHKRFG